MIRNASVMSRNIMQHSVTLCNALYRLQLAYAVGESILRRVGSDALFPNDFGDDLLLSLCWSSESTT